MKIENENDNENENIYSNNICISPARTNNRDVECFINPDCLTSLNHKTEPTYLHSNNCFALLTDTLDNKDKFEDCIIPDTGATHSLVTTKTKSIDKTKAGTDVININ